MEDIPQPKRGLPANNLEYQPRWGDPESKPHERDSTPARVESLLKNLNVLGKRVLDLGCNNGYYCFELEKHGAQCFGIDYYADAIHVCEETAVKYHMYSKFQLLDLNTQRVDLYCILTNFQPDIVLCNSIFHHMNDPDSLLEIVGIASKTVVIEFQYDKWADYIQWATKWIDSRCHIERLPDNWYNRQLQKDETGLKRAVMLIDDRHVDKKWIHYHDDGNMMRFELIEDVVRKYHYMGRNNRFMYQSPYLKAKPLEDIEIPPFYLRDKIIAFLMQMATMGLIHCELYRHLWIDPNGMLHAIDWDTQYDIVHDEYDEFFNIKIRINISFGCITESHWTVNKVLLRDMEDVNKLFAKWKYTPLTKQEKMGYFEKLREKCMNTQVYMNLLPLKEIMIYIQREG